MSYVNVERAESPSQARCLYHNVTGKMPVPQCHRQDACTTMSQARCLYHNVTGKMPVPQYILNNYLTKYMSFQEGVKIVNVL
jgi:hypothetical protein